VGHSYVCHDSFVYVCHDSSRNFDSTSRVFCSHNTHFMCLSSSELTFENFSCYIISSFCDFNSTSRVVLSGMYFQKSASYSLYIADEFVE